MNTAAKACIKRDEFDKDMRDIGELIREGMISPSEAGRMVEALAMEWSWNKPVQWVVKRLKGRDGRPFETIECKSAYEAVCERDRLRGTVELPEWYTVGALICKVDF